MSDERPGLHHYLAPRFWSTWAGLGIVRLACLLPYRTLMAFGRLLGPVAKRLLRGRHEVARQNIRRCLPHLDDQQREELVDQHFASLGMAIFETGLAWWASDRRLAPLCHVSGSEHVERALQRGRGVIMLSAHFTCLEICSRMLAMQVRLNPVYRGFRNPLLQEVMLRGRERCTDSMIAKKDIRQTVRALRNDGIIWYAPDQAHRGKSSQLVPFFGIPAHTNTATTRLAKLSGAPVLPFLPWRRADGSGYNIVIGEPLEQIPSDDEASDAAVFHQLIEKLVREVPEQYLWIHRRFKHLEPEFYSAA
ncbi:MAG: LpxL/LpxP family Kdo(2)-lipid IV(A) lauroyl/palmitoleoyl acyltransferase [Gammaproteobacteria bacterium]|nr:LpxL/LpxP family Kdo(2)-lipid IV(A) lauroyl/palmitoleoyl acyltransferase [Gammaproteobacteria bacterium]NNM20183.1 LpxL/LpxP family Kdo(2)-lipid IV(A) lauroyl/palmitoleoyl acyltransferase [Gammaproteobacteria bacterium]